MKNFLLYLWQLPQNLLGLLVILFTKAEKEFCYHNKMLIKVYMTKKYCFGVSLGNYIVFGGGWGWNDLHHENGHQIQSQYLGPLYLLIIGLPSALGNIFDRVAHKKWNWKDREKWYYSQPWEKWADKIGGVERL